MPDVEGPVTDEYRAEAEKTGFHERFVKMLRSGMKNMSIYDITQTKLTLSKPLVREAVKGKISGEAVALASAALSLGFMSRDIEGQDVKKMIDAIDIEENVTVELLLNVINIIKVRNHHPYLFAYYALQFLEKERTPANIVHMVRGLGINAPDMKIANEMIEYCNACESGTVEKEIKINAEKDVVDIVDHFSKVIVNVYDTMADFTMNELMEVTKGKGMNEIPADMYPYICAIAIISLCGRDVDRGSISEFLESVDIIPDDEILSEVSMLRFKNQVSYIVAIYYLVAVGREPNMDAMLRVVTAMGIRPDAAIAKKTLTYYSTTNVAKSAQ